MEDLRRQLGGHHLDLLDGVQPGFVLVAGVAERGAGAQASGQQRAGWATISLYGAPAGTPIQIFYSDKTAADGTVTSTGYTPNGQIQTDYYIARGTGTAAQPTEPASGSHGR